MYFPDTSHTGEQKWPALWPAYPAVHISTVRSQQPISIHQLSLWLLCETWMGQLGANPNKPKGCCNSTEIHSFEVLSLGKMLAQYSLVRDVPLALSFSEPPTRQKKIRWCVLFPCNLSQHSWWPNINQSGVMKLGNIFWDLDWVQSTRRVVNVCRTGSMIFDYFELLYLCSALQKRETSNLQHRELNVLKEQGRYKTTYVERMVPSGYKTRVRRLPERLSWRQLMPSWL